jgi:hypothetical protein
MITMIIIQVNVSFAFDISQENKNDIVYTDLF